MDIISTCRNPLDDSVVNGRRGQCTFVAETRTRLVGISPSTVGMFWLNLADADPNSLVPPYLKAIMWITAADISSAFREPDARS